MTRVLCIALCLVGCVKPEDTIVTGASGEPLPTPTVDNPLQGLPALTADGTTIALPTYTTTPDGQSRSVTFINVGDTETKGSTMYMPTAPPSPLITILTKRLRERDYKSLPWALTPDMPPFPMTMNVKGTELYFSGDPRTQIDVAVTVDGQTVGRDSYQVEGESESSSELVGAIGATVLWRENRGMAYVRYDIKDSIGRDSDWRLIVLEKKR